ncbi:SDR family NAD(P)-dependent oxidoreductase [Nocardia sp. NPDC004722]
MTSTRTAVIIGVGPGLGMSMARRFGKEGFRVALISRSATRHGDYLAELAAHGIDARTYTADVTDGDRLRGVLEEIAGEGDLEIAYYGPMPTMTRAAPITEMDMTAAKSVFEWVWPAVNVVESVLPGMKARGSGGILIAGGLSSVRPMPALGAMALSSAALRNYAVTLNAGLAETGVYAGTLTIGGLIERGDLHVMSSGNPAVFGDIEGRTLDPDLLADAAWEMYRGRDRAETVFEKV